MVNLKEQIGIKGLSLSKTAWLSVSVQQLLYYFCGQRRRFADHSCHNVECDLWSGWKFRHPAQGYRDDVEVVDVTVWMAQMKWILTKRVGLSSWKNVATSNSKDHLIGWTKQVAPMLNFQWSSNTGLKIFPSFWAKKATILFRQADDQRFVTTKRTYHWLGSLKVIEDAYSIQWTGSHTRRRRARFILKHDFVRQDTRWPCLS